jgi:hypothetical protein
VDRGRPFVPFGTTVTTSSKTSSTGVGYAYVWGVRVE